MDTTSDSLDEDLLVLDDHFLTAGDLLNLSSDVILGFFDGINDFSLFLSRGGLEFLLESNDLRFVLSDDSEILVALLSQFGVLNRDFLSELSDRDVWSADFWSSGLENNLGSRWLFVSLDSNIGDFFDLLDFLLNFSNLVSKLFDLLDSFWGLLGLLSEFLDLRLDLGDLCLLSIDDSL